MIDHGEAHFDITRDPRIEMWLRPPCACACVSYFNNIRLIDISRHTADDDVTRVEQTVVEHSAAAALRTLIEPNEARKLAIMKDIRSDENMLRGPLGSRVTGRRQGRRDVVVMTSRYLYPLCLNKHSDSKQSSYRTVYATYFTCTIFLKTMIDDVFKKEHLVWWSLRL